ncbi:MAG: hypothetical protein ACQGQO_04625 [Sphaerochaetaceae bacterium]
MLYKEFMELTGLPENDESLSKYNTVNFLYMICGEDISKQDICKLPMDKKFMKVYDSMANIVNESKSEIERLKNLMKGADEKLNADFQSRLRNISLLLIDDLNDPIYAGKPKTEDYKNGAVNMANMAIQLLGFRLNPPVKKFTLKEKENG